ncbi:MAG: hypothetical protein K0R94_591, partial [Burkholderiales bacterium]|nr:hypothetical protein [Burkholderiales bacterium]
ETRKEAAISADTIMREHIIPLGPGKYNKFNITCASPIGYKNEECFIRDIYISDISGKRLFSISYEKNIVNTASIPVNFFLNGNLPLLTQLLQFILHILPVLLILFFLLSSGSTNALPLALGFSIMFIYAMLTFLTVNTGMDALENINVAKNLFSSMPYYSYVEYRGYMWFLLLSIINGAANLFNIDFYYCYAIYGCLIFTLLVNYILPILAKNLGIVRIHSMNIILLGCALIFLYGKQFFCPLPDLTPAFFLLFGLALLTREGLPWKFFAGFSVAISCLIRSNYYISILFILIFMLLSVPPRFLKIILFLIPILFLFMSNKVFISRLPLHNDQDDVIQLILFKGITVQKTSPFEIKDNTGVEILKKEGLNSSGQLTISKYLELIKTYPLDFLKMYSVRVFNGLDIKYPQVYVSESGNREFFSLINYILIFLGIYYLYNYIRYQATGQKVFYILTLALPSLVMAQSFVETRYFLLLSLILISIGTLSANLKLLKNKGFISGLIIFLLCSLTMSYSVYNQV